MIKKWLEYVNIALGGTFIALTLVGFFIYLSRPDIVNLQEVRQERTQLPRNLFAMAQDAYDAIGDPVISLHYSEPKIQLPDLRQRLAYNGQNGRPDVTAERTKIHFSIAGTQDCASVSPGERLYLRYDKNKGPQGTYSFSPGNAETALWLEGIPNEKVACVKLCMLDDAGTIVKTPESYCEFNLNLVDNRVHMAPWEIANWKVDGTLLARQRARWFGIDRFFELHGGDEYREYVGKNRVDFTYNDDTYSVFIGEGSALIWKDGKWVAVEPGEESLGYPLMVVKKVEDRLMNLELWDVDGKKKMAMNLLRSMETWMPQNIQQEFKFLGARTRSHFVFEVNDEKMLLRPQDWLLLTDEGWKKIDCPEMIDSYVDRKVTGTLFIFDDIVRKDDQQVIVGTIFNPTRTEIHSVELPVQKEALAYHNIESDKKKRMKERLQAEKSRTSFAAEEKRENREVIYR